MALSSKSDQMQKEVGVRYFSSAVGRKQIMGITGLIWSGFVLSHMLGNLLIFAGAEVYNRYSHALISNPLLYVAEAGLLLTLFAHVYLGIKLTAENRAARKTKYAMPTNGAKAARFQSKFMIFHGSLLLVFIITHLISFKYGPGPGEGYVSSYGGVEMRDLHRLIIERFQNVGYVAWYLVAMVGVGLHLAHGFYSSFASLGFYHPRYSPALSKFGYVYAVVVSAGFISQPLYVFLFAQAQ